MGDADPESGRQTGLSADLGLISLVTPDLPLPGDQAAAHPLHEQAQPVNALPQRDQTVCHLIGRIALGMLVCVGLPNMAALVSMPGLYLIIKAMQSVRAVAQ